MRNINYNTTKQDEIKAIMDLLIIGHVVKIKNYKYKNYGEIVMDYPYIHYTGFGRSAVKANIKNLTFLINNIFHYKNIKNIDYEYQT